MTAPSPATLERELYTVRARTVKDFCRTYGVGKSMVYDLINDGTLDVVKAGTRTLILEESATAWFETLPRRDVKK